MTTESIRAWCLVIGWMALIFWFSTAGFSAGSTAPTFSSLLMRLLPAITPEQIEIAHFAVRKLGHWSEYFVLAGLILRALITSSKSRNLYRYALIAVLGAVFFALSDEWHQSFVPSREASLVDVTVDSFGALCGAVFFMLLQSQRHPQIRSGAAVATKLDNAGVKPQG